MTTVITVLIVFAWYHLTAAVLLLVAARCGVVAIQVRRPPVRKRPEVTP